MSSISALPTINHTPRKAIGCKAFMNHKHDGFAQFAFFHKAAPSASGTISLCPMVSPSQSPSTDLCVWAPCDSTLFHVQLLSACFQGWPQPLCPYIGAPGVQFHLTPISGPLQFCRMHACCIGSSTNFSR